MAYCLGDNMAQCQEGAAECQPTIQLVEIDGDIVPAHLAINRQKDYQSNGTWWVGIDSPTSRPLYRFCEPNHRHDITYSPIKKSAGGAGG